MRLQARNIQHGMTSKEEVHIEKREASDGGNSTTCSIEALTERTPPN
jgi:hypothetical protein